jgi:PPOX class probable F420-dependent enzyme
MAELPADVRALFEGANFAHIATVLPDGGPHTVPIWVGLEGDRIAFFTQTWSRKARNIERDPRVALSIADFDNPYRYATVRGRVVERVDGEEALAVMDRMSVRYTGKPFPYRESGSAYFIEPERSLIGQLGFEHTPSV